MRLARFDEGRFGVVRGETIVDVTDALDAAADEWPPVAVNRLIANWEKTEKRVAGLAKRPGTPLSSVKLLTPVPWPSKIIAFPVNYHDHGAEMTVSYRADNQGFFLKPPSSLIGPGEPIVLPHAPGRRIDHECELAIVIGRTGRHIPRDDADDYVFGYSCLIDAVIRGDEERVTRKAFDTFCPVGPWLVTADEIGDAGNLRGQLWVNDELRQDANTSDLVLDIPGMIEMASSVMTLYPGDIIASGTSAGVGPMRPGDRIRIAFERIGSMTLDVVADTANRSSLFAKLSEA
jgi:2-keto-4-pentenoate hydratase/2-oxohepta-3-ene-1,7-dioic acid hydratase in catechol pathway